MNAENKPTAAYKSSALIASLAYGTSFLAMPAAVTFYLTGHVGVGLLAGIAAVLLYGVAVAKIFN